MSEEKLKWRLELFKYGILAVLFVLEYLKEKENYEECQLIVNAIKEQNNLLQEGLPTEITKDTIIEVISAWKRQCDKHYNSDEIINAYKYYSEIIISEHNL